MKGVKYMTIKPQRNGTANDQDRQQLATLLFKLGYTVRIAKISDGKKNIIGVEIIDDEGR